MACTPQLPPVADKLTCASGFEYFFVVLPPGFKGDIVSLPPTLEDYVVAPFGFKDGIGILFPDLLEVQLEFLSMFKPMSML